MSSDQAEASASQGTKLLNSNFWGCPNWCNNCQSLWLTMQPPELTISWQGSGIWNLGGLGVWGRIWVQAVQHRSQCLRWVAWVGKLAMTLMLEGRSARASRKAERTARSCTRNRARPDSVGAWVAWLLSQWGGWGQILAGPLKAWADPSALLHPPPLWLSLCNLICLWSILCIPNLNWHFTLSRERNYTSTSWSDSCSHMSCKSILSSSYALLLPKTPQMYRSQASCSEDNLTTKEAGEFIVIRLHLVDQEW